MRTFNALAALLALVMLARHGRRALGILTPRGDGTSDRLAALVPLLTCLVAAAVLVVAAKGLLPGNTTPGATP